MKDRCAICTGPWPCPSHTPAPVFDESEHWKALYMNLLNDWGALCDIAQVESDAAVPEVVAGIVSRFERWAAARKTEKRCGHDPAARGWDYWCIAPCHATGACDGECDPECNRCPDPCPMCERPHARRTGEDNR